MPVGLCNAPGKYQILMNTLRQGLIGRICLAYLDDVIVYSADTEQHLKDLEAVFCRILDAGLKMKARKYKIFRKEFLNVGHKISDAGVETDPEKIRAVVEWPGPTTLK